MLAVVLPSMLCELRSASWRPESGVVDGKESVDERVDGGVSRNKRRTET